jgi:hypothetical protein
MLTIIKVSLGASALMLLTSCSYYQFGNARPETHRPNPFRGTLVRMKMTRRPDGPPPASISLSRARYSASSRTAIRIGPPLGVCRSVSSSMRDPLFTPVRSRRDPSVR